MQRERATNSTVLSASSQSIAEQTCVIWCNRCGAEKQDSNITAAAVSINRFAFRGQPTMKSL